MAKSLLSRRGKSAPSSALQRKRGLDVTQSQQHATVEDFDLQILQTHFVGRVCGITLRDVHSPTLLNALIRLLNEYPVLVFADQPFTDEAQIAFAERLTGQHGHVFFSKMTTLDEAGQKLAPTDFRRVYYLATRLWHTDGSCGQVPSRYSMLSARTVPPTGGETEFADMRAAYDALREDVKAEIDSLEPVSKPFENSERASQLQ